MIADTASMIERSGGRAGGIDIASTHGRCTDGNGFNDSIVGVWRGKASYPSS
jgi:hypothetical protein